MKRTSIVLTIIIAFIGLSIAKMNFAEEKASSSCTNATSPKSNPLYSLHYPGKGRIKQISNIHLVPPGSKLVQQKIYYDQLRKKPIHKSVVKDAEKSLDFFQAKLQEQLGPQNKLKFLTALFNVYKDIMGNYTTDVLYIVYDLKDLEKDK